MMVMIMTIIIIIIIIIIIDTLPYSGIQSHAYIYLRVDLKQLKCLNAMQL